MISFPCPQCGSPLTIAESFAGRRGKCPKCSASVQVPQTPPAAAEPPAVPAASVAQPPPAPAPAAPRPYASPATPPELASRAPYAGARLTFARWQNVANGLSLAGYSLVAIAATFLLFVAGMALMGLRIGEAVQQRADLEPTGLELFLIVVGLLGYFAGHIAVLIGWFNCLGVPEDDAAVKRPLVGAVACALGTVALIFVLLAFRALSGGITDAGALAVAGLILITIEFLLYFAAFALFARYLRGVACRFDDPAAARRASCYSGFVIVFTLWMLFTILTLNRMLEPGHDLYLPIAGLNGLAFVVHFVWLGRLAVSTRNMIRTANASLPERRVPSLPPALPA